MSLQGEEGSQVTADQRDLPPGGHLRMLLGSAVALALLAALAMRYFL